MKSYTLRKNEDFLSFQKTTYVSRDLPQGAWSSSKFNACPLSLATPHGIEGVYPIMDGSGERSARYLATESEGEPRILHKEPLYLFDSRLPEPKSHSRVSLDGCIDGKNAVVAVWLRTSGVIAKRIDPEDESQQTLGGDYELIFGLNLETGEIKKERVDALASQVPGFDNTQQRLNRIQARFSESGLVYVGYKNQILLMPLDSPQEGSVLPWSDAEGDRLVSFDCLDDRLHALVQGESSVWGAKRGGTNFERLGNSLVILDKNLRRGSYDVTMIGNVPGGLDNVAVRPFSDEAWVYSNEGSIQDIQVFNVKERAKVADFHLPVQDLCGVSFSNKGERINIVHGDFPHGWRVSQFFIDSN